jgi:hypothetical protein
MPSKWDLILEQQPKLKPLDQHLLDEVAKLLVKDLGQFPPPIEGFENERDAARFAPLFAELSIRPSPNVYRAAFLLARLELERDPEAPAEFLRNERYKSLAPTERDKLAMLFLSRWLGEQLLSLNEAVNGRYKRAQLLTCLDQIERRLLGDPLQA